MNKWTELKEQKKRELPKAVVKQKHRAEKEAYKIQEYIHRIEENLFKDVKRQESGTVGHYDLYDYSRSWWDIRIFGGMFWDLPKKDCWFICDQVIERVREGGVEVTEDSKIIGDITVRIP